MANRTNYRNGDEINLHCGCDDCCPSMINGVLCHETGCSEEWRDYAIDCFQCGCDFLRTESRFQSLCDDCLNPPEEEEVYYE